MKKTINKALSWLLSVAMLFGIFLIGNISEIKASASGVDNITARADYLYNLTWTAKKNVNGWKNRDANTFYQGNTYHIPYGQPVSSGKYVYWGVSIDDYVAATQNAQSVFYTKRSSNSGAESTYYAMDCSAFTSYCWGLSNRTTTSSWSNLSVTSYGKCTSGNVGKIQQGDTLCLAGSHVVLVSRVNSNGTYEITEETPPQLKRSTYSASSLVSKYSSYTIYRYNKRDSVLAPPNSNQTTYNFPGAEDTSYAVPAWLKAKQKGNTYDNNGNIESNRWIDAGDNCYVEKVYSNGFVWVKYPISGGERWAFAKASLFDIPKKPVTPQGHVMSESEAAGRTIPDGDYYIVSEIAQNYYVDIPGDDFDTPDGKNVEMWIWGSCIPDRNGYDCFHIEYLNNGFYKIRQIKTNMCLDVNGASISEGSNIWMWEDNGSSAQQWSIEQTSHGYRLRARCNAYYMDVEGGAYSWNTNIRCWSGNNSKAQSFSFIPRDLNERPISDGVYTIKTKMDRNCFLDVTDVPGNFYSGSNIQIWRTAPDDPEEKYTIKYVGDGWYRITEKTSGLLMELADPNSGFLEASRNVQLFSDNGGNHQLWKIKKNSDGTFFIINKASGYYLDLEGENTNKGTNVSQHPYNGNNNQRWYIEPYTNTNTLSLSEETITMSKGSSKTITVNFSGDDVRALSFYIVNGAVCTGSWGTVEPGKCLLTLCGQGSGKTTLTVSLLNSSEQKIISKNITVNVFTFDLVGSPIDFTLVGGVNITNSGEIPLLEEEHKYTSKIVKPTCTEQGYTLHTCSECGNSYKDNYSSATGHSYGLWITTKQPTCTADGTQQRKCSDCGNTETQTIKATGHSYTTSIIQPTYTEQGYTLHTCSKCGHSYKDNYTDVLVKPLVNQSTVSKNSTYVGDSIIVTAKASGGTSPYNYAYYYKKTTDSAWTKIAGYSTAASKNFKPASAGTYTARVNVKDSKGSVVQKDFTVKVTAALKNSSTISSTSVIAGTAVTLTGKASGGTSPYKYAYYYKKSTDSAWTRIYTTPAGYAYTKNTEMIFKPTAAGTYNIRINVKDENGTGTMVSKDFTVKVTSDAALKNNSAVSATTVTAGTTVTMTGKATGGTAPYKFAYYYKKSTDSAWTKAYVTSSGSAYTKYDTMTFIPNTAGTYNVRINVKDNNGTGTAVSKDFTVTVK